MGVGGYVYVCACMWVWVWVWVWMCMEGLGISRCEGLSLRGKCTCKRSLKRTFLHRGLLRTGVPSFKRKYKMYPLLYHVCGDVSGNVVCLCVCVCVCVCVRVVVCVWGGVYGCASEDKWME